MVHAGKLFFIAVSASLIAVLLSFPHIARAEEASTDAAKLTPEQRTECYRHRSKEGIESCVKNYIEQNVSKEEAEKKEEADPKMTSSPRPPPKPCPVKFYTVMCKTAVNQLKIEYSNAEAETDISQRNEMKEDAAKKCYATFDENINLLKTREECKGNDEATEEARRLDIIKSRQCSTGGNGGKKQTEEDAAKAKALMEGKQVDGVISQEHLAGYVNEKCVAQSGGVQVCQAQTALGNVNYYKDGYGGAYTSYEAATSDQYSTTPTAVPQPKPVIQPAADPVVAPVVAESGGGGGVSATERPQPQTTPEAAPVQAKAAEPAPAATNTGGQAAQAQTGAQPVANAPAATGFSGANSNPYNNSFLSSTSNSKVASNNYDQKNNYGSSFGETTSGYGGGADNFSGGGYEALGSSRRSSGSRSNEGVNASASGADHSAFMRSRPGDNGARVSTSSARDSRATERGGSTAEQLTGYFKPGAEKELGKSSLAGSSAKKQRLVRRKAITASTKCRSSDLQCIATVLQMKRSLRGKGGRGLASVDAHSNEIGRSSKDILSHMAGFYDKQFAIDENGNIDN